MNEALFWIVFVLIVAAIGFAAWRRSQREIDRLPREHLALGREREEQIGRARRAGAQLRALGLAVLEVIVVVDHDLHVTYATPGARELFGMDESVGGRSLIAFTRSG